MKMEILLEPTSNKLLTLPGLRTHKNAWKAPVSADTYWVLIFKSGAAVLTFVIMFAVVAYKTFLMWS
nr:hypothetical protein [Tanacetum cinerariifolium]